MKIPAWLCAGASVLLLAGSAIARETGKPHAKTHRAPKAHVVEPAPPKDPYANYWNDPGRAAPPFSYHGQP
jgi:hypothetical protein